MIKLLTVALCVVLCLLYEARKTSERLRAFFSNCECGLVLLRCPNSFAINYCATCVCMCVEKFVGAHTTPKRARMQRQPVRIVAIILH